MLKNVLAGAGAMVFMFAMAASAQEAPAVDMSIDHAFFASGKMLPAGEYTLTYDSASHVFSIMGLSNKADAMAFAETRLSQPNENLNPAQTRLVFDVVGSQYGLSEIWIPGQAGYRVAGERLAHARSVTKTRRS
jgi:hypothetical protein